jgi:hypothetical protein
MEETSCPNRWREPAMKGFKLSVLLPVFLQITLMVPGLQLREQPQGSRVESPGDGDPCDNRQPGHHQQGLSL